MQYHTSISPISKASEEQVEMATDLIKKLHLKNFSVTDIQDPGIQNCSTTYVPQLRYFGSRLNNLCFDSQSCRTFPCQVRERNLSSSWVTTYDWCDVVRDSEREDWTKVWSYLIFMKGSITAYSISQIALKRSRIQTLMYFCAALQKQYRIIEAVGLEEDDISEIEDETLPDSKRIERYVIYFLRIPWIGFG